MLVKDVLQKTTQFFKDKGYPSPRLDTELLISAALRWERIKLYLQHEYPLSEEELTLCRDFVRRRASGEPVAYILGKKDFYNHSFIVSPGVLIPRPETELIVEQSLAWAKTQPADQELRVVDLGVGSGCIGLSIIAELSTARLFGVDISLEAAKVAIENAQALSLNDRASFEVMDASALSAETVRAPLGGLADILVANPPYIAENDPEIEPNVKKFEPSGALFSSDQGLSHIKSWASKAAELVREDGFIMFEIGHTQGRAAAAVFESLSGFSGVTVVKDLSGRDRFIKCLKKA
jgi:release factor glutamine methyltransferase